MEVLASNGVVVSLSLSRVEIGRSKVLGNVVISKKFLCTRKIMVMYSNERGECDPRTLVDRQRKR